VLHELNFTPNTGSPKKVSHYRIIKKIGLKPAIEIRFILQVKAFIKHYNTLRR